MGAFNTLRTAITCPCGRKFDVAIQFKFGDTFQHDYILGDELKWGGNDVGRRGVSHVVLDGVAVAPCSICARELEFYIHVEKDRISRVELADGRYNFINTHATFLVVRE